MATLADMRTSVLGTLGENGSGFITSSDVNGWLNNGLNLATEATQSVQAESYTTSVANQAEYALPPDLILLQKVFVGDDELLQASIGEWRYRKENASSAGAASRIYAEWNGTLFLYPAPEDSGSTIRLYYLKAGSDLSGDSDVPDLVTTLHHILEDYALYRAYLKMRRLDMAAAHKTEWVEGVRLLKRRYGPKMSDYGSRIRVVR